MFISDSRLSAVLALRDTGFVCSDPVKSNVVDAASARVVLLDFEHAVPMCMEFVLRVSRRVQKP